MEASAERTRSTALRCTMVSSQERALPLPESNRAALRQISRKASWATSSAWAGSRTTRTASPKTRARRGVVQLGEGGLVAAAGALEQVAEPGGRPGTADAPSGEGAPAGTG